jgi:hypothetical protein
MTLILERALLGLAALTMMATGSPLTAQSGTGSQTGACSLLTKELVLQTTPESDTQTLDRLSTPPEEHRLGPNRSLCDYAGITLHLNPFSPKVVEQQLRNDRKAVSIPGLGDAAWFRDVGGVMGELYVRSGPRNLGVALEVPEGRTVESVKPRAIAIAKAVLSRPW